MGANRELKYENAPEKNVKQKKQTTVGRSVFVSEGEAAVWADSLCGVHGSITGEMACMQPYQKLNNDRSKWNKKIDSKVACCRHTFIKPGR